jgi:hypothetical protein
MPTSSDIRNLTDADLQPIRVLVAESDLVEIDRIKANIDRVFQAGVKVVKTYDQLLGSVAIERPHLVILGKIDRASYSEISQGCHQILPDLPIVLLSSQGIIIDSFRKLVITCGLTDVVSRDPTNLNQLLQKVATTVRSQLASKPLAAQPNRQHLVSEPLGAPPPPIPGASKQKTIA